MGENCPECLKKDFEAKLVERDHKTELEKAAAEAERLKVQLAEASKPKLPEPVENWFEHTCTDPNCGIKKAVADHDLEIAGNVVTNLSRPEGKAKLLEIMKAAKVEEFPDRIIISGLPERR